MGNVSETTGRQFYIFQFFMCFLMKIVINLHVICLKEKYVVYKQVIPRTLKKNTKLWINIKQNAWNNKI